MTLEQEKSKKKFSVKSIIALCVCAAVLLGAVAFDFIKSSTEYNDAAVAMGTVVSIKLRGFKGKEIAESIKREINATETSLLSRFAENSDVARINANAGATVSVSSDTANVLLRCKEFSEKSGGVFDVTVGKITSLWNFDGKSPAVPSEKEINSLLGDVDCAQLTVAGHDVTIGKKQSLDLGAVGKGFACDRIRALLESSNTDSAVISVGGSLLIYGNKKSTIGIVNPTDDSKSMGYLKLKDTCVSTSGDYEKFFEVGGVKYHHIINANTGRPADSRLSSVTVVCRSGLDSDALSTVCYLLGCGDSALKLLEDCDAQAVFVFKDKSVRVTDGLKDSFTLTDESFVVSQ